MLQPDEELLYKSDPALPSLEAVLNPDIVSSELGVKAHRKYIRYKPGASAIALYETDYCLITVETMADPEKLSFKSRGNWPTSSLGLGRKVRGNVAYWEFPNDRLLPAACKLDYKDKEILAYKPQRRLVVRDSDCVTKFYTKDDYLAIKGKGKTFRAGGPILLQERVRKDRASRSVTYSFIPGKTIESAGLPRNLSQIGAAIGYLHKGKGRELPAQSREDEIASLMAAASFTGILLPDLKERIIGLAQSLAKVLRKRAFKARPIHGDLTGEQLIHGEQIGFIDLDRACLGDPAYDLGSFIANSELEAREISQLVDAYSQAYKNIPNVALQTACAFIRSLPDCFKSGSLDWPSQSLAKLERAEKAIIDQALPELNDVMRLPNAKLIKHKPGRRAVVEVGDKFLKIRAKGVDNAVEEAYEALRNCNFTFGFPKGVVVDRKHNRIVLPRVGGTEAEAMLFGGDLVVASAVGRALAEFHNSQVTVSRKHTVVDELAILASRLGESHHLYELCSEAADRLLAGNFRPIHRDFHPGQILHSGNGIGIIDFDLLAMGDPAVDVGNFIAHLDDAEIRLSIELSPVKLRFFDAYQQGLGPALENNVQIYRALSLTRLSHIATERPDRAQRAKHIERFAETALKELKTCL